MVKNGTELKLDLSQSIEWSSDTEYCSISYLVLLKSSVANEENIVKDGPVVLDGNPMS